MLMRQAAGAVIRVRMSRPILAGATLPKTVTATPQPSNPRHPWTHAARVASYPALRTFQLESQPTYSKSVIMLFSSILV